MKSWTIATGLFQLSNCIIKCKSIAIKLKEEDEVTQQISSQILIVVKPLILMENVTSRFGKVKITWTFELFFWKKPQSVFTYRYIVYNSSHRSYI